MDEYLPQQSISIREIIQQIGYSKTGEYLDLDMNDFEKRVDQASAEIKSLLKSKLPKNEEMKTKWVSCASCGRYVSDIDYNYVLTEIERIIETL